LASYKESTQDAVWEVKTEQTLAMEVPLEKDPYFQENFLAEEEGDLRLKNDRILFAFDSYRITRDSKEILDEMVQVFLENPGLVVRIDSHTDSRGSNQYNQWLSEKRAESTRDYLLSQGVNPAQIADSVGHGEDDPQAKCTQAMEPCEENLHKQNRRSVFEIVSRDRLYQ
jgi:outer membrane protein OmpA-like peptidoglycan-associated protein